MTKRANPIKRWTQSFPRARARPPRANASLLSTKRRPGSMATPGSCAPCCALSSPLEKVPLAPLPPASSLSHNPAEVHSNETTITQMSKLGSRHHARPDDCNGARSNSLARRLRLRRDVRTPAIGSAATGAITERRIVLPAQRGASTARRQHDRPPRTARLAD
jgi:hypothetical protein